MTDQPDLREQIAAHLAGDLDAREAAALQARIESEPWVGALADEVADLLVRLGRVDEVEPPEGYGLRLRAGLEAAIGHPVAGLRDGATTDGRAAPHDDRDGDAGRDDVTPSTTPGFAAARGPGTARPRDTRPGRMGGAGRAAARWQRPIAVAAAVAVVAVVAVGVLLTAGGRDEGGEDAAFQEGAVDGAVDSLEADDASDAGLADEAVDEASRDEMTQEESAAMAAPADGADADGVVGAGVGPRPAPVALDLGATTEGRLADDVGRADAVLGLLGADVAEAAALREDARTALDAASFPDGTPASTCLEEVLAVAGDDAVPAVVARGDVDGSPSAVIGLARPDRPEGPLAAVEVWVVEPGACDVRQIIPVDV